MREPMAQRLQTRSDFDSTIKGNPVELLNAIREHALSFQETKYDMSTMADAFRHLINTKQADNEGLVDYSKRFRVASEVLTSHLGGPIVLQKIVTNNNPLPDLEALPDDKARYNELLDWLTKEQEIQQEECDRFLAYLYLVNSDQDKYGSLTKH